MPLQLPSDSAALLSPRLFAGALSQLAEEHGRPFNNESWQMFVAATGCTNDDWPADAAAHRRMMNLAYRLLIRALLLAGREESEEISVPIVAAAIADQR